MERIENLVDELIGLMPGEKICRLSDPFSEYFVSTKGRVFTTKKWVQDPSPIREMSQQDNGNGYKFVVLMDDGDRHQRYIHQLVAEGFIGDCPEGEEVRHLNGDRDDNRIENIEYATHKDNVADRVPHGTHNRGERHNMVKLTRDQVEEIRNRYRTTDVTQAELVTDYPVSQAQISNIINGKSWRHLK